MSVPIYGLNDIYIIRSDQCDSGWSVHLHGAEDSVGSPLGLLPIGDLRFPSLLSSTCHRGSLTARGAARGRAVRQVR